jgi:hypothetical protein
MGYCLINQVQIGSAPVSGVELVGSESGYGKGLNANLFRRTVLFRILLNVKGFLFDLFAECLACFELNDL